MTAATLINEPKNFGEKAREHSSTKKNIKDIKIMANSLFS